MLLEVVFPEENKLQTFAHSLDLFEIRSVLKKQKVGSCFELSPYFLV